MKKSLAALALALFAASTANVTTAHANKKCPDGKYYDESKGKCVTKRGS